MKVEKRKDYLDAIELRQNTDNAETFNELIAEEALNSLKLYLEALQGNIRSKVRVLVGEPI